MTDSPPDGAGQSLPERLRTHVSENRFGMVADLVFAVAWVTMVTVLFDVIPGPQWAYYLCLLAGIPAYFGFFISLEVALERQGRT